jgi:hypothetical protein
MEAQFPILIVSAAWTEEWRMGIRNKNQRLFHRVIPVALALAGIEAAQIQRRGFVSGTA